jgi:hypothetical protein
MSRASVRGGSFVEVVVLIVILGVIGVAAMPGNVDPRTVARTNASRSLGEAIAAATVANYQRYTTTGKTDGVAVIEQCDPATFASLVGGSAPATDTNGGLLVFRDQTYLVATATPGPRFAGGVSYCTIVDARGGSPAQFPAVTCPDHGTCAP